MARRSSGRRRRCGWCAPCPPSSALFASATSAGLGFSLSILSSFFGFVQFPRRNQYMRMRAAYAAGAGNRLVYSADKRSWNGDFLATALVEDGCHQAAKSFVASPQFQCECSLSAVKYDRTVETWARTCASRPQDVAGKEQGLWLAVTKNIPAHAELRHNDGGHTACKPAAS